MPYRGSLLQLALLLFLASSAKGAQIQGIPTPYIYQGTVGSYDAMNHYQNAAAVNGLASGNPSHLGARWSGPYVDLLGGIPGVLAYDNTKIYNNGAALSGLNGPVGWSGTYVDQIPAFPALTWDNMSVYSQGSIVDNTGILNGGLNNGSSVNWPSGYIDPFAGPGACSVAALDALGLGTATVTGVNSLANMGFTFVAGHDAIVTALEFVNQGIISGSSQTVNVSISDNGAGSGVMGGTITLDNSSVGQVRQFCPVTPYLVISGHTYTVLVGGNSQVTRQQGNPALPFVSTLFTSVTDISPGSYGAGFASGPVNFKYDVGYLWQTNVLANGGSSPSVASINAVDTWWAGVVADGIAANLKAVNVVAPDNLIAAQTPVVYFAGSKLWANHNLVSGDLSVNGLTGNASNKYLDTGVNPSTALSLNSCGQAWYCYNQTASGFDIGAYDGTHDLIAAANHSDAHTYAYNFGNSGTPISFTPSPGNGFYADARISSTDHRLYFANSGTAFAQVGATDSAANAGSLPNLTCFFLGENFSGALQLPSSDTLSAGAFYTGLGSSGLQQLYNRLQTLRVTFGGGFR